MKTIKGYIIKVLFLVSIWGLIWLLLPSGPFWFLWYGERPGPRSVDDLSVVLSICSLIFCLSIIGYSLLTTLFTGENVEGQELEGISVATT